MPTSDAVLTRDRLVRRALSKLGVSSPSNSQIADAVEVLNIILKEVDDEGKWLWTISNTESTITLSANTASYTTGVGAGNIAVDILQLETFYYLQGTDHIPVRILTKEESLRTYLRDDTGQPYAVYLERKPLMTSNVLRVFPTPNGTYTGKYTYRRRLYDFDSASDNPDFPQGWDRCLYFKLAADLSHDYGTPLQTRDYLQGMADRLLRERRAANADKSSVTPIQKSEFY
jgi:lipoprotein-anchoring transpeptidase ErfK/SrfK